MIHIYRSIRSFVYSQYISLVRVFDHTYRKIIGVPTLRRSQITPQLFLGGQYSTRGFNILKQRGVTAIVSMRSHARKALPDLGEVRFLHLSTPDQEAPTLEKLKSGIDFITHEIKNGGIVYVHCAHGEGRGPSMVIAYLMSTGLTLKDGLAQVIAVRGFVKPSTVQIARLLELEKILASQAAEQAP